jgi:hypothetical protein
LLTGKSLGRKSPHWQKGLCRVNWHELAWDKSVREHFSLQDACINLARAVEPINLSFVTRPFADSKVFGLEKAALAERPLSELTGANLR